jgi:hypothetical protein
MAPVALIAACSDTSGPRGLPGGVEIRTSSAVVPIEVVGGMRRATISAQVKNESGRIIFYSYCGEGISVRENGSWNSVWRPVCASILVPPEPIAPGQARTVTVFVDEDHHRPGLVSLFDPARTYRMDVTLLAAKAPYSDKLVVIDPGESVSNSFTFAERQ